MTDAEKIEALEKTVYYLFLCRKYRTLGLEEDLKQIGAISNISRKPDHVDSELFAHIAKVRAAVETLSDFPVGSEWTINIHATVR